MITMGSVVRFAAACAFSTSALAYDGWHLESATVLETKASSFDYISYDASKHRLFLGHRKAGLHVFDIATKTIVKTIEQTAEHISNGALLLQEFDLGISSNEDGTITPFSLSTLEARAAVSMRIGAGTEVDTSYYDPATKRIFVHMEGDERGTDIHILEAPSLKVIKTIRLAAREVEHGVADGQGHYYLAARDLGMIYQFDTKEPKFVAKWPTTGCTRPTGLAYNSVDNRVLIGCRGDAGHKAAFAVFDPAAGEVTATYEIGAGNDGVVWDAAINRVFFANGVAAHLAVFERTSPDAYKLVEALGTRPQVKTVAYDPGAKKLYAMTAEASADFSKKINVKNGPFYPNTFIANTFTVLTYSK